MDVADTELVQEFVLQKDYIDERNDFYRRRRAHLSEELRTYRTQVAQVLAAHNTNALPVIVHNQLMVMRNKQQSSSRTINIDAIMGALHAITNAECECLMAQTAMPMQSVIAEAVHARLRNQCTVRSALATVEDYVLDDPSEAEIQARSLTEVEIQVAVNFVRASEQLRGISAAKKQEMQAVVDAQEERKERVVKVLLQARPDTMMQPLIKTTNDGPRQFYLRYKRTKRTKPLSLKLLIDNSIVEQILRPHCHGATALDAALTSMRGESVAGDIQNTLATSVKRVRDSEVQEGVAISVDRGHLLTTDEVASKDSISVTQPE